MQRDANVLIEKYATRYVVHEVCQTTPYGARYCCKNSKNEEIAIALAYARLLIYFEKPGDSPVALREYTPRGYRGELYVDGHKRVIQVIQTQRPADPPCMDVKHGNSGQSESQAHMTVRGDPHMVVVVWQPTEAFHAYLREFRDMRNTVMYRDEEHKNLVLKYWYSSSRTDHRRAQLTNIGRESLCHVYRQLRDHSSTEVFGFPRRVKLLTPIARFHLLRGLVSDTLSGYSRGRDAADMKQKITLIQRIDAESYVSRERRMLVLQNIQASCPVDHTTTHSNRNIIQRIQAFVGAPLSRGEIRFVQRRLRCKVRRRNVVAGVVLAYLGRSHL